MTDTIDSFYEIESYNFFKSYKEGISKNLNLNRENILTVNEEEYINELTNKYLLEPITIHDETQKVLTPRKDTMETTEPFLNRRITLNVYEIPVEYSFSGTPKLFEICPGIRTLTSYEIYINANSRIVGFIVKVTEQTKEAFDKALKSAYNNAFVNVQNVNKEIENFNQELKVFISDEFKKLKKDLETENNFFNSINVTD